MNGMPTDIYDIAHGICLNNFQSQNKPLIDAVAKGILSERERCAKIAEEYGKSAPDGFRKETNAALNIAVAIRQGG